MTEMTSAEGSSVCEGEERPLLCEPLLHSQPPSYKATTTNTVVNMSTLELKKKLTDARTEFKLESGDDNLTITGYQTSPLRTFLFYFLSIITLGIFRLIAHWSVHFYINFRATRCTFDVADLVTVVDDHMAIQVRRMITMRSTKNSPVSLPDGHGGLKEVPHIRFFTFRKLKYFWLDREERFVTCADLEAGATMSSFRRNAKNGLSTSEVGQRMLTFGLNEIEVKLKPILVLLFREAISPFYIFQVFSVTVWFTDQYIYYACVIILMSVLSITTDIYQTRKQERKLRSMVHSVDDVSVLRNGGVEERIRSDQVAIPEVEVGEEMDERFDIMVHAKHVLFCGTQVLQTRYYSGRHVKAVVLRTAYSTLKGQLVRSIMYPKPVDFRFTKDLFKFVGFLATIAFCGFGYTIAVMISRQADLKRIIIRSLDIVTVVVPPALPAAMSVGIIHASMRLRRSQIFCISPSVINTCGAINTVCFDKTGTLTEDGLDFQLLRPVEQRHGGSSEEAVFIDENHAMLIDEMPHGGELIKAIATCHSLTRIGGVLHGDPLDLILFKQTHWTIEENTNITEVDESEQFDQVQPTLVRPPDSIQSEALSEEYSVVRQFTFSSSLQRMTVIVADPMSTSAHNLVLYTKGSPEMIATLCSPSSIPVNYHTVVSSYAQKGLRLIAVAYKPLAMSFAKAQKVNRNDVECDLIMLGIVVMENRIKPQTLGVINQLYRAHIRCVMVTGDNLLTAMSVARECGIIRPTKRTFILEALPGQHDARGRTPLVLKQSVSSSDEIVEDISVDSDSIYHMESVESTYHLAVNGVTFATIVSQYPEMLDRLVAVCDVYARMSPEQKAQLVNCLQNIDYTVGFCGDGANDCGALKAAHAGISLSDAEASIAAPFTSKVADISCVPNVIREGRAALVTSFGVFKYMAGYSLTQFVSIMLLYWIATNLTDFQFLYIDLFLITIVAVFFGTTPACEHISSTPPPMRLLSPASVTSIILQLAIIAVSQFIVFYTTSQQPWFAPYSVPAGEEEEDKRSMQGTSVFLVSIYQYLYLAVVYSKGAPYRKSIFSNRYLVLVLSICFVVSLWVTFFPIKLMISFLELDYVWDFRFHAFIFMIACITAILAYLAEYYAIEYGIGIYLEKFMKGRRLKSEGKGGAEHERLLMAMSTDIAWMREFTQSSTKENGHTTVLAVDETNGGMKTAF